MQPLPVTRIVGKQHRIIHANHRHLVTKSREMLFQFLVRDMPRLHVGSVGAKRTCY